MCRATLPEARRRGARQPCAAPDAQEMARRIADYGSTHAWLVAVREDEVVGYAYGSPHRTRAAYASSCDVAIYVSAAAPRAGPGRHPPAVKVRA